MTSASAHMSVSLGRGVGPIGPGGGHDVRAKTTSRLRFLMMGFYIMRAQTEKRI